MIELVYLCVGKTARGTMRECKQGMHACMCTPYVYQAYKRHDNESKGVKQRKKKRKEERIPHSPGMTIEKSPKRTVFLTPRMRAVQHAQYMSKDTYHSLSATNHGTARRG